MSSKTKIVVLRMKEIIYTAIFAGLAILLITLCFIMFRHGDENTSETDAAKAQQTAYVPGVYSTSLTLGNEQVNVEVTVDKDQIRAVTLVPPKRSCRHHVSPDAAHHGRPGRANREHPVNGESYIP